MFHFEGVRFFFFFFICWRELLSFWHTTIWYRSCRCSSSLDSPSLLSSVSFTTRSASSFTDYNIGSYSSRSLSAFGTDNFRQRKRFSDLFVTKLLKSVSQMVTNQTMQILFVFSFIMQIMEHCILCISDFGRDQAIPIRSLLKYIIWFLNFVSVKVPKSWSNDEYCSRSLQQFQVITGPSVVNGVSNHLLTS